MPHLFPKSFEVHLNIFEIQADIEIDVKIFHSVAHEHLSHDPYSVSSASIPHCTMPKRRMFKVCFYIY